MKYNKKYYNKVCELASYLTNTINPKMKWMWGEALLGYALDELDKFNNRNDHTDFLIKYCDYWVKQNPKVDQSDTLAPGLITYAMYKRTGNEEYKKLTDKVLDYIQNEPRLIGNSLNHLGSSFKAKLYPKSVWVDSLMMFSVFTSLYGHENNDKELIDFASKGPIEYSDMMMDKNTNLWYHSYWVKRKQAFPGKDIYWGRGNGWVICALPMILDNIGLEHENSKDILKIYSKTSEAILKCIREDYTFSTILNDQSTYRELSATLLISAGWMHAIRCGYISKKFEKYAVNAFISCVNAIVEKDNGLFLPEISGPTIPLQVFPKFAYKKVPLGENWSYGVAALIFAAIEYKKLLFK